MKKVAMIVLSLAFAHAFGSTEVSAVSCDTNNTPHIETKVRSPLGKEIDGLRQAIGAFVVGYNKADFKLYTSITNLAQRVEALEAKEAERERKIAAGRARIAERRREIAESKSRKEILQSAKKRAKKTNNK